MSPRDISEPRFRPLQLENEEALAAIESIDGRTSKASARQRDRRISRQRERESEQSLDGMADAMPFVTMYEPKPCLNISSTCERSRDFSSGGMPTMPDKSISMGTMLMSMLVASVERRDARV